MKKLVSVLLVLATLVCMLAACNTPKATMKRGEKTDSAYTNEVLGLTFTLPSGWRFYTDEEIAATMNMSADLYKDENLLESAKATSVMDFMAVQESTGNNVNMTIENLKVSNNAKITVEKYLDVVKEQLNSQMQGVTYTFKDAVDAKLGNADFMMLEAACSYSGVKMTQYMYLKKEGIHMVLITCTSVSGADRASFEAMFS